MFSRRNLFSLLGFVPVAAAVPAEALTSLSNQKKQEDGTEELYCAFCSTRMTNFRDPCPGCNTLNSAVTKEDLSRLPGLARMPIYGEQRDFGGRNGRSITRIYGTTGWVDRYTEEGCAIRKRAWAAARG